MWNFAVDVCACLISVNNWDFSWLVYRLKIFYQLKIWILVSLYLNTGTGVFLIDIFGFPYLVMENLVYSQLFSPIVRKNSLCHSDFEIWNWEQFKITCKTVLLANRWITETFPSNNRRCEYLGDGVGRWLKS